MAPRAIAVVILQIDVSIDLLDEIQRNLIAIQINASITNAILISRVMAAFSS